MADDRTTAYAEWLAANKDKQDSPEFKKVAAQYKVLRAGANLTQSGSKVWGAVKGAVKQGVEDVASAAGTAADFISEVHGADFSSQPMPISEAVTGAAGHAVRHPVETVMAGVTGAGKAVREAVADPTGEAFGRTLTKTAEMVGGAGPGRRLVGQATDVVRGITPAERAARDVEKALPKEVVESRKVAKAVGLPPSDEAPGMMPKGQDLESLVQEQSQATVKRLAEDRSLEATPKWRKYRERGKQLEAEGKHFTVSEAGANLMGELHTRELGGSGMETAYTDAERKAAKDLRLALSGLDKTEEATFPVSLEVVDKELRHLRAMEHGVMEGGYNEVVAKRSGDLADMLEGALKKWVGEENYPRPSYAAASKPLNKWKSKLGRALVGEQDLDYLGKEDAQATFQGLRARKLFSSADTVKEGIALIGEGQMAKLAEQFISNSIRGKNSGQAYEWLVRNQWVSEFPDANQKALAAVKLLAERQGDVKTLKGIGHLLRRAVRPTGKALGLLGTGAGIGYGGSTLTGYTRGQ
jgi:hypothetical protein